MAHTVAAVSAPHHAADAYQPIDPATFDYAQRYKLFTASVIPRPLALVTTRHPAGHINAAPFSQFIIVAVEPGLLGFSVGPQPGRIKDTLDNIRHHPEFVINTVCESMAGQTQHCAIDFPADTSEVDETGLHLIRSTSITVDRIAESKLQFECRLHSITAFGASHLVVGAVTVIHALHGLVRESKIDPLEFAALGRLAGRNYCRTTDVIAV